MTQEAEKVPAADAGPVFSEGLGPNAQAVARWYCVSRDGMATLCVDEEDARANATHCDQAWRAGSPHRAVRLVDAIEADKLQREVAMLRATMEDATYQLSKARIWGGMDWHYNPLHPMHYKPALDRMRKVLDLGA
jgi:hypothetical protein